MEKGREEREGTGNASKRGEGGRTG